MCESVVVKVGCRAEEGGLRSISTCSCARNVALPLHFADIRPGVRGFQKCVFFNAEKKKVLSGFGAEYILLQLKKPPVFLATDCDPETDACACFQQLS